MYKIDLSHEAINKLKAIRMTPGIGNGLYRLESNPLEHAVPLRVPIFGEYYINAGNRYCIVFDVDEENQIVKCRGVLASPFVHKVMTGKL